MSDTEFVTVIPAPFRDAVESLRAVVHRRELTVSEVDVPGSLAPYSIAFAGDVNPVRRHDDSELATGRFVVFYDPASQEGWDGPWRIVIYARAPLEPEIGGDPFLAEVAWSWLLDSLSAHGARAAGPSGTVTRVVSQGFGELRTQTDGAELELRASWSPGDLDGPGFATHAAAWGDVVCMLAGLPPLPDGVSALDPRRSGA